MDNNFQNQVWGQPSSPQPQQPQPQPQVQPQQAKPQAQMPPQQAQPAYGMPVNPAVPAYAQVPNPPQAKKRTRLDYCAGVYHCGIFALCHWYVVMHLNCKFVHEHVESFGKHVVVNVYL